MVPEVKNAPYGRLALVGCDVNPVSWRLHATKHNKEIQRLTRVFRFVGLLLLSKWQKATVIPIAAMIPMIQSTILSPAMHVNIDDIEVEDNENFSLGVEEAEPDPENYKPYEDEPIATEEWLSEYKRRQETQVEFERN